MGATNVWKTYYSHRMAPRTVSLDPDVQLRYCAERRIGLDLPPPISDRIDDLIDVAEAGGERTTRKEIVAALILAARPNQAELARLLKEYRLCRVRDARVREGPTAGVVPFPNPPPGPRKRRLAQRAERRDGPGAAPVEETHEA